MAGARWGRPARARPRILPGVLGNGAQRRRKCAHRRGETVLSRLQERLSARALLGVLALALSQSALAAESPAEHVRAVRVWPAPEYTRVTLESAEPLRHHLSTVKDPERLVLDLEGVDFLSVQE